MICKYDEGFTIQKMLEETNICPTCTMPCPNAQLPRNTERDKQFRTGEAFNWRKIGARGYERREILREKISELAKNIYYYCPESRERSLAFTKLEEAFMWANKAIANYGE